MENLRVAFEPFIDNSVRGFIDDGVNNYNIAATALSHLVSKGSLAALDRFANPLTLLKQTCAKG